MNRKQRRLLKRKYKNVNTNLLKGENETEKIISDQLNEYLSKRVIIWKKQGYNKEEILLLSEAASIRMFKNKKTYRKDKIKVKKLIKRADELKNKRNL